MGYFKAKYLCDKSLKIKNLRWQFSCNFHPHRRGILRFFSRRRNHGEIWWSILPVLKIFTKVKKREFWDGKIWSLEKKFHLFSSLIFLACPRPTFWTPKLSSRTQNEDFQWWSTTDHKLSFLCGSKQWPFGLKQFVRFKAIYCPLKIYKVDTLIFFIWSV